ncbi:hypothetical protein MPSEU_000783400 [Mayamaea pseudoterrestris]|nr:hypothetical protein MPSEU_000783400 [Mayamaea pseudoterrestris]
MTVTSPAFYKLVQALKCHKKTLTVVEQCCGGLISSSILAQPGASAVYYGGSVSYNTKHSKPLLLNDEELYQSVSKRPPNDTGCSEAEQYIQSKLSWTAATSVAFCKALNTDFAIAEGGASGPTFRPNDMDKGFAVVCVAGKGADGKVSVLKQEVIHSETNDREPNMRLFADQAAEIATSVITTVKESSLNAQDPTKASKPLGLDRAVHLRSDASALTEMRPSARFVLLQGAKVLLQETIKPALLDFPTVQKVVLDQQQLTFLGIMTNDRTPMFAVDLDENSDVSQLPTGTRFADTRTTAPLFTSLHNELVLHATALSQWQRRTKFCTACGGSTRLIDGGTACQCTQCSTKSWPRQDPSMIVLISSRDGQRVLLAKSPRHPDKMYTVLAGFVEAGEAFEATVVRETFEETGVIVDEGSMQYCGSQPWPFPQSCMIGFIATADDTTPLNIDTAELVDAKWFSRSDVERAATVPGATMQKEVAEAALKNDPSIPLLIPPKNVIARKLIDRWLDQGINTR